jgi:hypothetical protein
LVKQHCKFLLAQPVVSWYVGAIMEA